MTNLWLYSYLNAFLFLRLDSNFGFIGVFDFNNKGLSVRKGLRYILTSLFPILWTYIEVGRYYGISYLLNS